MVSRSLLELPLGWLHKRGALSVRVASAEEARVISSTSHAAVLPALEVRSFPDDVDLFTTARAVLEHFPALSFALGGGDPLGWQRILDVARQLRTSIPSAAIHLNLPQLAPSIAPIDGVWRNFLTEPVEHGPQLRWFDVAAGQWEEGTPTQAAALAVGAGASALKVNHAGRVQPNAWHVIGEAVTGAKLGLEPAGGVDEQCLEDLVLALDGFLGPILPHVFTAAEVDGRVDSLRVESLLASLERSLTLCELKWSGRGKGDVSDRVAQ